MDWDIFRYVVAIADSGSAVAAAQRLGVNGSTVLRRISKFEDERGIRLFDRLASGYTPTLECEALIKTAREMQKSVESIELGIAGQDLRLEGQLTITTTDTMLETVLSDIIVDFTQLNPRINLEVAVTNDRLSLSRRDADVAIRPSKNPPEHLVGIRVSPLSFGIYVSDRLASKLPQSLRLSDLFEHPWIGTSGMIAESPVWRWMEKNIPAGCINLTADTFPSMRSFLRNGGVGVLPSCIGEPDAALKRLMPPIKEIETSLWVLTHPEMRKSAKVKAFTGYVAKRLREKSDLMACR